jgi:hypothetical protein
MRTKEWRQEKTWLRVLESIPSVTGSYLLTCTEIMRVPGTLAVDITKLCAQFFWNK